MKILKLTLIASTLSLMLSGCNSVKDTVVNKVSEAAGLGSAKTVTAMWPDVPVIEGATQTEFEMPLVARGILKAMSVGAADAIGFATSKNKNDVEAFYTLERMKKNGWVEGGCAAEAAKTAAKNNEGGAAIASMLGDLNFCGFTKKEGTKDIVLILFVMPPEAADKSPTTKLLFIRGNAGESK
jgi:hypothetical protein